MTVVLAIFFSFAIGCALTRLLCEAWVLNHFKKITKRTGCNGVRITLNPKSPHFCWSADSGGESGDGSTIGEAISALADGIPYRG